MEPFTATAESAVSGPNPMVPTTKPHPTFRKLFLFLLLATFISAGATAFILMTGTVPKVVPDNESVQTSQENPFNETVTTEANPFTEESETSVAVNPFADDETSTNPFDQFDAETATSSSDTYENPF